MTYLSDILFDISVDRDTHMSPATVYHFPFSMRAAPALNRLAAAPPYTLSVRFYYSRTEVSPTVYYLCSHLSLPYSRLCISSYRSGNQYSVRFYYSRTETLYLVLQTRPHYAHFRYRLNTTLDHRNSPFNNPTHCSGWEGRISSTPAFAHGEGATRAAIRISHPLYRPP